MHSKPYKFFLILGITGMIDIISRSLMKVSDLGIVSLAVAYVLGVILGADIAGLIAVILSTIFSFGFMCLIVAFFLRKQKASRP